MKEYTCDVVIKFSYNIDLAENIEDYKEIIKESFLENHNIELMDSEIINIEENK